MLLRRQATQAQGLLRLFYIGERRAHTADILGRLMPLAGQQYHIVRTGLRNQRPYRPRR